MRQGAVKAVAVTLAAGMVLTGCIALSPENKMRRLDNSIEKYSKLIRWGEYERAIVFLEPSNQQAAYAEIKSFKDIRVTSYEMKQLKLAKDENSADAVVEFTYFHEFSGRERTVIDKQHWEWHDDEGNWRLRGTLPRMEVVKR